MNQQNKEYAKVSRDNGWLFCFEKIKSTMRTIWLN